MSVVIGIPMSLDAGELRPGRATHYLDAGYARALAEAGATPLYLPPEAGAEEAAGRIDGLLLPGGDDLPAEAGHPAAASIHPAPPQQIAADRALLAAALERRLPVLGICYGMQLLALEQGGELLFHLPHDRPDASPHNPGNPDFRHPIRIEPNTKLAEVLGPGPTKVNSRHHQAVATPGPTLQVSARAADGIIEAIEAPSPTFVLGVQWHPESMEAKHRRRLFTAFTAAAKG